MYNGFQFIHLKLKLKNHNEILNLSKPYDPLLLQSLDSFRGLMIGEFYKEELVVVAGGGNQQQNEMTLVVKVKHEECDWQTINDESDWQQTVGKFVKNGKTLQFQLKSKCTKKILKKQMKEIELRLKEIERETQILQLKKLLIKQNLETVREQEVPPRDKLLESIRKGKKLKHSPPPSSEKVFTFSRDQLMNEIKTRRIQH